MAQSRKFRSNKCVYEGINFDSNLERDWWIELKKIEDKGEIFNLRTQVKHVIQESFRDSEDKKVLPITYTADHMWEDREGITHCCDSKASEFTLSNEFKLKWKMMKYKFRDFKYHLVIRYGGIWYDLESKEDKLKYKEAKEKKRKSKSKK